MFKNYFLVILYQRGIVFFPADTLDLLPTSPEYYFSVFFFPSGLKKKKNSRGNDDQNL